MLLHVWLVEAGENLFKYFSTRSPNCATTWAATSRVHAPQLYKPRCHWPYSWVCVGLSLCWVHYNTINRPIFFNLQLFVSKSKNRVSSPWVVVRQLQPCAIRVYLCWFILWFLWWVIVVVEKYSAMEVKIQKEEDEIRARRDARLAREKAAANKGNILLHYDSYCTVRKENTEQ